MVDGKAFTVTGYDWTNPYDEKGFDTYEDAEAFALEAPTSDPIKIYDDKKVVAFVYQGEIYTRHITE
jgi:hypothetical protein